MGAEWIVNTLIAILSAAFAAGGAWIAVKSELKWLRRDVDRNARELEKLEDRRHADTGILHDRITRLNERITAGGINGGER